MTTAKFTSLVDPR